MCPFRSFALRRKHRRSASFSSAFAPAASPDASSQRARRLLPARHLPALVELLPGAPGPAGHRPAVADWRWLYLGFRLLEALEGLPAAPVQRGKAKIMGVSVVAKPAVLMQKMDNLNNLLEVLMTTKGVKVRAAHGALIPARHICPHARGPGSVAAPSSAALRLAPRRRRFARLCLWLLWTSVRGLSSA